MLLQIESTPPDARHVTYVLDRDLVRFGKFTLGILAIFLVVGAYLFGFKLEESLEKVRVTRDDLKTVHEEMRKAQQELESARTLTEKLKSEVSTTLQKARYFLEEIESKNKHAGLILAGMQTLTPEQRATANTIKEQLPGKVADLKQGKLWKAGSTLRVRFLNGNANAHALFVTSAGEWAKYANIKFDFVSDGESEIRVQFNNNNESYSYVGTDALGIPQEQKTISIGFLNRRTVLHEIGHILGLIEEHQNPKANIPWKKPEIYTALTGPPNYWSKDNIEKNIFSKIPEDQLPPYRDFDPLSIMNMDFPPDWTGNVQIKNNGELSVSDKALIAKLYPR